MHRFASSSLEPQRVPKPFASLAGAAQRPKKLLRMRGGYNHSRDDGGAPPQFVPRDVWMPKDREQTAEAISEAWEERERQRELDVPSGIPPAMSVGQARERIGIALAQGIERKEREDALHRQLTQHILRLKEAHAQMTTGAQRPPEVVCSTTGSPQRVRHRSRPPSASPGPFQHMRTGGSLNCDEGASRTATRTGADSHHEDHDNGVRASKSSTDWTVEGIEERILQHRQDVVRQVMGTSSHAQSGGSESNESGRSKGGYSKNKEGLRGHASTSTQARATQPSLEVVTDSVTLKDVAVKTPIDALPGQIQGPREREELSHKTEARTVLC